MRSAFKISNNHARKILAGTLALSCVIPLTGCKSGFKIPGADLFSWNRKPSEELLASEGPSMSLPPSPATNHEPQKLASLGSGTKTSSGSGTKSTGGSQTKDPPSIGLPTGLAAAPAAANSPGNAATANGFQVGPYGMAGGKPKLGSIKPANLAGTTANSTGLTLPPNVQTSASAGLTGKPSGVTATQQPSYALNPSNRANPPAIQSYGGIPKTPTYVNTASNSPSNAYAKSEFVMPTVTGAVSGNGSSGGLGLTAPPINIPASSVAATNQMINNGAAALNSAVNNAATNTVNVVNAAANNVATVPGGYRPGSTGRSTGFAIPSQGSNSVTVPASAASSTYVASPAPGLATPPPSSPGLPPLNGLSVPPSLQRTATGTNSPGYTPPSGSSTR